jgi:hypothetical protein
LFFSDARDDVLLNESGIEVVAGEVAESGVVTGAGVTGVLAGTGTEDDEELREDDDREEEVDWTATEDSEDDEELREVDIEVELTASEDDKLDEVVENDLL